MIQNSAFRTFCAKNVSFANENTNGLLVTAASPAELNEKVSTVVVGLDRTHCSSIFWIAQSAFSDKRAYGVTEDEAIESLLIELF